MLSKILIIYAMMISLSILGGQHKVGDFNPHNIGSGYIGATSINYHLHR